jgi:hypothetical protein
MGAGFKSLVGGELQGMTKNVIDSRNEAMTRLFAEAQARGGNALIAMRFDTTELGTNWTEICAYGTAVVAIPVTEAAKQTAIQLGYGQPAAARPAQAQQPAAQPTGYQPAQPTGYQPTAQPTGYQPTAQPTGYQPTAQPTGYQPTAQPGSEWDRPAGGEPPPR